jgi:hypothetical protein
LSDASDSRSRALSCGWGGSSSNVSNWEARLSQTSDEEGNHVGNDADRGRQERCFVFSTIFISLISFTSICLQRIYFNYPSG